jgi:adenylosuccinate lyase
MMAMTAKGMGRQDAHETVREASMIASSGGEHLLDVLLRCEKLKGMMTETEIREAMEPANYLGGASVIVDDMITAVENALGKKVR